MSSLNPGAPTKAAIAALQVISWGDTRMLTDPHASGSSIFRGRCPQPMLIRVAVLATTDHCLGVMTRLPT